MKRFRIAVIPDIHIGREKINIHFWDREPIKGSTTGNGIEERLREVVKAINKDSDIRITVLVGDITNTALPEQFERAEEILRELRMPYIPLVGNHDVWSYRRDEEEYKKVTWESSRSLAISEFERYFENSLSFAWLSKQGGLYQNYSFTIEGIQFLVIDNVNRAHSPFGLPGVVPWSRLHNESKEWLEKEMLFTKKRRAIIFSHSPIEVKYLKGILRRSLEARSIFNITGHNHRSKIRSFSNLQVVTTNALYLEPKWLKVYITPTSVYFEHQSMKT